MNAIKVMNVTTKTSFMNIKYIKSTLKIECLFTHDVRQDYNKYYKTVIPNLIGNLILMEKAILAI